MHTSENIKKKKAKQGNRRDIRSKGRLMVPLEAIAAALPCTLACDSLASREHLDVASPE